MIRADIETEVLTDKMKVDIKTEKRKYKYEVEYAFVA